MVRLRRCAASFEARGAPPVPRRAGKGHLGCLLHGSTSKSRLPRPGGSKVCAASNPAYGGEGFYDNSGRNDFGTTSSSGSSGSDGAVGGIAEQLSSERFTHEGVRVWVLREETETSKKATLLAGETEVNASPKEVWEIVRQYERYADIFPNVRGCGVVGRPEKGRAFLGLSVGMRAVYWEAEASLEVEVEEVEDSLLEKKQVNFYQVEGDFELLVGRWVVEPSEDSASPYRSLLRLELEVDSKAKLPRAMTNHIVRKRLASNIKSLAKQAEARSMRIMKSNVPLEAYPEATTKRRGRIEDIWGGWRGEQDQAPADPNPHQYLGVSEVPLPLPLSAKGKKAPLPPPASSSASPFVSASELELEQETWDAEATEVEVEAETAGGEGEASGVQIHLRKLDTEEYVHNRVIATTEIAATRDKVWDTLTDYDKLPTILPNLVLSQRVESSAVSTSRLGRLRLRQVVFKELMYLRFRAEALLDVLEKPKHEIQFKLSNGTFDKLQGKFILETVEAGRTRLVYAVEIRIPRGIQTFAVTPLVEKFAYEDVANNIAMLRRHVESATQDEDDEGALPVKRPATSVLCSDFAAFEAELKRTFGEGNKTMPKKGEFRTAGRFDLEKACYAHGGFSTVAARIGWKMQYQRKPRDYWADFENLSEEISMFIEEEGLTSFPERKLLKEKGRMDIVRAIYRWGGVEEVANRMKNV